MNTVRAALESPAPLPLYKPSGTAVWLLVMYAISGATALGYQVLWVRVLAMQFGVSTFGVVVTAAAFMLGLGVGSMLGTRLADRITSPLRVFAVLELAVVVYALLLPSIQQEIDAIATTALSQATLATWYAVESGASLLLLALPAVAMGVGFPIVLEAAARHQVSLGAVYGINTLGAALGALLPLVLLPILGWQAALWVVAAGGCAVAMLAWSLDTKALAPAAVLGLATKVSPPRPPWQALLCYAGVGAAALMLEVGWVRLYGMLFLRTEYVMAVILAVYLAGIGFGSIIARRLDGNRWLTIFPLLAAAGVIAGVWALPWAAQLAERTVFSAFSVTLVAQGAALALFTLPVTLILGAWLPLLSARYGVGPRSGAWLYGANCLGAACGAALAGFVLLPAVGTTATILLAGLGLFCFGMAWSTRRLLWISLPVLVLLSAAKWTLPPAHVLLPRAQAGTHDLALYEDAVNISHVTEQANGQRLLLQDLQRMDASSDPTAVVSQKNQVRLPLLLHSDPKSVLFLGVGTGISAGASLALDSLNRTGVELAHGAIIAAAQWFAPVNGNVMQHMAIIRDDARRYLKRAGPRFDVIIGDLFHPDLVGRSALLSHQQFARARQRLGEGGVFVQWLALNQFDQPSLAVILRSFRKVFPDAVIFVDGFRLAMVGASARGITYAHVLEKLAKLDAPDVAELTGEEGALTWLGRYWGAPEVGEGALQDEWAPRVEYDLPRVRERGVENLKRLIEWLLQQRPSLAEAVTSLAVPAHEAESFERAFAGAGLALSSWSASLEGDVVSAQRLLRYAHQANPRDRGVAASLAEQMWETLPQALAQGRSEDAALREILAVYPDHVDALARLAELEASAGVDDRAAGLRARVRELSPFRRDQ